MAKFNKHVLTPDTYQSPQGQVPVTRERMRHWVSQHRKMREAGLNIPATWGHPRKYASYDEKELRENKYNAGFVDDLYISGDRLMAKLDIPLEEDAKRIGTVLREVSPVIFPAYTDGKKRIWQDCIPQMGLVVKPVVPGQENFMPESSADALPAHAFCLALSQRLAEDDKVPEDDDEKPEGDDENALPSADGEDEPEGDVSGTDLTKVVELLGRVGILLGDGVDPGNFVAVLTASIETKLQAEGAGTPGGVGQPLTEETPAAETISMSTPMRLDPAHKALPEIHKLSLDNKRLSEEVSALRAQRLREHSSGLGTRLDALVSSGRATPVEVEPIKQSLGAVRFSLTKTGEFEKSAVEAWIEARESLPAGAAFPMEDRLQHLSQGAGLLEHEPPRDYMAGRNGDAFADKKTEEETLKRVLSHSRR